MLRSERSMYIKDFNSACISMLSHSRAARSFFIFAFSRQFTSFLIIRRSFWIFWWGCPSPHFLVVFIDRTFCSTLMSSNVFLFIIIICFLSPLNFHHHLSYQTWVIDSPPRRYCFQFILHLNVQNHLFLYYHAFPHVLPNWSLLHYMHLLFAFKSLL